MSVSDGAVSFTRTAPAASVIAWAQDPRLQDPLHCANLLLQEFDDPSGILQSALLLGLVIRCASQIALDYRRVEGPTGCLDTQLTRTNSGGSCCDLHLLRRRSGPSHDGGQRYEVQHTTPALGSTTDAAMLHGLQRRIMYITDSHVEDSGIKEGAPPSVVRVFVFRIFSGVPTDRIEHLLVTSSHSLQVFISSLFLSCLPVSHTCCTAQPPRMCGRFYRIPRLTAKKNPLRLVATLMCPQMVWTTQCAPQAGPQAAQHRLTQPQAGGSTQRQHRQTAGPTHVKPCP